MHAEIEFPWGAVLFRTRPFPKRVTRAVPLHLAALGWGFGATLLIYAMFSVGWRDLLALRAVPSFSKTNDQTIAKRSHSGSWIAPEVWRMIYECAQREERALRDGGWGASLGHIINLRFKTLLQLCWVSIRKGMIGPPRAINDVLTPRLWPFLPFYSSPAIKLKHLGVARNIQFFAHLNISTFFLDSFVGTPSFYFNGDWNSHVFPWWRKAAAGA